MNAFAKMSAVALGTALAAATIPSTAQAATIVQTFPFDIDLAIDGSSTSYSFGGTFASPFEKFDGTSPLQLQEVILGGSIEYDFEVTCPTPGCVLGLDATVGIAGVGSESFSSGPVPVPPGTITDELLLGAVGGDNPFSGAIAIAPDFLPLDVFVGAPGEPLFPPISFSGTLTSTPSIFGSATASGEVVLTYEAVPEPATTAGLAIAAGMGLWAKRKKSAATSDSENA